MKTAIEQASANAKGSDDVAKFKSMLDALSIVYRDQSIQLVDQVHEMYTKNGSDILAYIQLLSQNKNLDRRQQLHREMLQSFLLVAQQHSRTRNGKRESPNDEIRMTNQIRMTNS